MIYKPPTRFVYEKIRSDNDLSIIKQRSVQCLDANEQLRCERMGND